MICDLKQMYINFRNRWKKISSRHRRSVTIHEEHEEDEAYQKIFEQIITIQMKIEAVKEKKSEQLFNLTKLGKPLKYVNNF